MPITTGDFPKALVGGKMAKKRESEKALDKIEHTGKGNKTFPSSRKEADKSWGKDKEMSKKLPPFKK